MNTPTPLQPYDPANPQGYMPMNRTAGPVKVFGILYAVCAVLSALGFLVLLALAFIPSFANRDLGNNDAMAAAVPKLLFGCIAIVVGAITALQAVTAYGLLALKSWGRTLAIVTGIISCISIPIGTILGGLTLYFLIRQGAEQEYTRLVMERNRYPGAPPAGTSF